MKLPMLKILTLRWKQRADMTETYLSNAWKTIVNGLSDDKNIPFLSEVNCRFENRIVPKMLNDGGYATEKGVSYKDFDFQFLEQAEDTEPSYKMTLSQAIRLIDDFEMFGYADEMNSLLRDVPTLMKTCMVRNGSIRDCSWAFKSLNDEEMILIAPELIRQGYIHTEPLCKALSTDPISNLITEKIKELHLGEKINDVIYLNALDTVLNTFANSLQLVYKGAGNDCYLPIYRLEPYEFGEEKIYVSLKQIVDTVNRMLEKYNRFRIQIEDKPYQVETIKLQLDYDEVKKAISSEKQKEEIKTEDDYLTDMEQEEYECR